MAKTGSYLSTNPTIANDTAIQVGGSFTTTDSTASPQVSPLAYTTGIKTITVPDNAVEFIVFPTTDIKISELSDVSTYWLNSANVAQSYPCAKQQYIYFQRVSANGTLYFRFTIL